VHATTTHLDAVLPVTPAAAPGGVPHPAMYAAAQEHALVTGNAAGQ
jgi:hypothetical protein